MRAASGHASLLLFFHWCREEKQKKHKMQRAVKQDNMLARILCGSFTFTLRYTTAAMMMVARPSPMRMYCRYSKTVGRTTKFVRNVLTIGPSIYPF